LEDGGEGYGKEPDNGEDAEGVEPGTEFLVGKDAAVEEQDGDFDGGDGDAVDEEGGEYYLWGFLGIDLRESAGGKEVP
jgi:hypothetical protein